MRQTPLRRVVSAEASPRVCQHAGAMAVSVENRMSTDDTASNNSGGMTSGEGQTDRERRAEHEAFEFSIPVAGRVRVENFSHDDVDEHEYVVDVEDGTAIWCTCPDHEHRNIRCKHMIAVEDRPAIMAAASASEDEIESVRESGTGADSETIRHELGDDAANAMGVEDEQVNILDVSEQASDTDTTIQVKRKMPEPRDGSRMTTTEYVSKCVTAGCEHVEIAWSKSDLRNRLREHARANHHDETQTQLVEGGT